MFSGALIVANPIAGRGRGQRVALALAEGLRRRGVLADIHFTRARGDGRARVAEIGRDVDLVVAVGGDGTLREVLEGLPSPEVPVALVPAGTGNVLAAELGLPRRTRDAGRALEMILAGRTTLFDVGRVNGRLCLLACGVGLDALLVRQVDSRRHGPITRWHYVGALLRLLPRYRPPRLTVEIDGCAEPGPHGLVLIANTARYVQGLRLSPDRRLDDGRFEVYLFPDGGRRALIAAALRAWVAGLPGRGCTLHRARRVRVTGETPVPYQVDGDPGGETPMEFEVGPGQYRLIVP
jgi:diacylglycerol kinase (ATP)